MNQPWIYMYSPSWAPLPPPSPPNPCGFLSIPSLHEENPVEFSWMYLYLSSLLFPWLLSSVNFKASRHNQLTFLFFFFFGMALFISSSTLLWTINHSYQAYYEPELIPGIYLLPPLNIHKGFDFSFAYWPSGFPHFHKFNSEFTYVKCMFWATVNSRSYFCSLYTTSQSMATKNAITLISVLIIWLCACVKMICYRYLSQHIQIRSIKSLSIKPLMVAQYFRWSPVSTILITWNLD